MYRLSAVLNTSELPRPKSEIPLVSLIDEETAQTRTHPEAQFIEWCTIMRVHLDVAPGQAPGDIASHAAFLDEVCMSKFVFIKCKRS